MYVPGNIPAAVKNWRDKLVRATGLTSVAMAGGIFSNVRLNRAILETTAAERIEFPAVDQYTILAQLFARAAATRGPAPIPLEDSIKTMTVLDALRRSAASGCWEDVPSPS